MAERSLVEGLERREALEGTREALEGMHAGEELQRCRVGGSTGAAPLCAGRGAAAGGGLDE